MENKVKDMSINLSFKAKFEDTKYGAIYFGDDVYRIEKLYRRHQFVGDGLEPYVGMWAREYLNGPDTKDYRIWKGNKLLGGIEVYRDCFYWNLVGEHTEELLLVYEHYLKEKGVLPQDGKVEEVSQDIRKIQRLDGYADGFDCAGKRYLRDSYYWWKNEGKGMNRDRMISILTQLQNSLTRAMDDNGTGCIGEAWDWCMLLATRILFTVLPVLKNCLSEEMENVGHIPNGVQISRKIDTGFWPRCYAKKYIYRQSDLQKMELFLQTVADRYYGIKIECLSELTIDNLVNQYKNIYLINSMEKAKRMYRIYPCKVWEIHGNGFLLMPEEEVWESYLKYDISLWEVEWRKELWDKTFEKGLEVKDNNLISILRIITLLSSKLTTTDEVKQWMEYYDKNKSLYQETYSKQELKYLNKYFLEITEKPIEKLFDMEDRLLPNINKLFDSYDLFSGTGRKRNIERMKQVIPDITELEIMEVEEYLQGFYRVCVDYGDKLAMKYKTPFLPDDTKNDVKEYVSLCRQKYPQIDEEHILGVFSMVCWLANR